MGSLFVENLCFFHSSNLKQAVVGNLFLIQKNILVFEKLVLVPFIFYLFFIKPDCFDLPFSLFRKLLL